LERVRPKAERGEARNPKGSLCPPFLNTGGAGGGGGGLCCKRSAHLGLSRAGRGGGGKTRGGVT